jgi:hypothetical protein
MGLLYHAKKQKYNIRLGVFFSRFPPIKHHSVVAHLKAKKATELKATNYINNHNLICKFSINKSEFRLSNSGGFCVGLRQSIIKNNIL